MNYYVGKICLIGLIIIGISLFISGCGPEYPNCETDEHCREHNEFCVNGRCAQCRNDNDCPRGQECNSENSCQAIEGWCETAADCPEGQICRDNRCSPCSSDSDCGMGQRCEAGRCVEAAGCTTDDDCPAGQRCINGACQAQMEAESACSLESVYFDFDQSNVRSDARSTLQSNVSCIRERSDISVVTLEGNCDPRGTTEYNMALGMRRSKATKNYMMSLGIQGTKMRTVSYGEEKATGSDESGWSHDRRVDFGY